MLQLLLLLVYFFFFLFPHSNTLHYCLLPIILKTRLPPADMVSTNHPMFLFCFLFFYCWCPIVNFNLSVCVSVVGVIVLKNYCIPTLATVSLTSEILFITTRSPPLTSVGAFLKKIRYFSSTVAYKKQHEVVSLLLLYIFFHIFFLLLLSFPFDWNVLVILYLFSLSYRYLSWKSFCQSLRKFVSIFI